MVIFSPWKQATATRPYLLNKATSLTKGAVFAVSGQSLTELTSGVNPVLSGVTQRGAVGGHLSWNFPNTSIGNSDMNFGVFGASTADLGNAPATWAFFGTFKVGNQGFCMAHTGGASGTNGWFVGGDISGGIQLLLKRSTTNLSKRSSAYLAPASWRDTPHAIVVTYDGTNNHSGVHMYIDGYETTYDFANNGVGTYVSPVAENLWLGRGRFLDINSGVTSSTLAIAFAANRVWSQAEAKAFANDPYQIFVKAPAMGLSFGGIRPGPMEAEGSATLSGSASLFGMDLQAIGSATFGGSAELVQGLSGTGSATFGGSAYLRRVGSVGDFDYVPCDCATAGGTAPEVVNVSPAPGTTLQPYDQVQFDVIDVDTLFRRIIVYASYPNGVVEIVHTGDNYCPVFINSIREAINSGYRYRLNRNRAWPDDSITITIAAINTIGQEA